MGAAGQQEGLEEIKLYLPSTAYKKGQKKQKKTEYERFEEAAMEVADEAGISSLIEGVRQETRFMIIRVKEDVLQNDDWRVIIGKINKRYNSKRELARQGRDN